MGWKDFKNQLIQIDSSKKMRESKWIAVCKSCQCERTISYAQAWNIMKEKFPNVCANCREYKPNSGQFSKGISSWNKGIEFKPDRSYEKNKIQMEVVNAFGFFNEEIREKQRLAKLNLRNEQANNWQGGKVRERNIVMGRDEYKQLRSKCFNRDNFTCQICFKPVGSLEMDHIKEWCNYPELRLEIANVRTLCKPCHKMTDNYGTKALRKKGS